jgi:hypothetical protein
MTFLSMFKPIPALIHSMKSTTKDIALRAHAQLAFCKITSLDADDCFKIVCGHTQSISRIRRSDPQMERCTTRGLSEIAVPNSLRERGDWRYRHLQTRMIPI